MLVVVSSFARVDFYGDVADGAMGPGDLAIAGLCEVYLAQVGVTEDGGGVGWAALVFRVGVMVVFFRAQFLEDRVMVVQAYVAVVRHFVVGVPLADGELRAFRIDLRVVWNSASYGNFARA